MKKPSLLLLCLNRLEYSCPLPHFKIMKFGKWMLRQPLRTTILKRVSIWLNQRGSLNRITSKGSRSWNIKFDTAIKSYDFKQNVDEPCVYKRIDNSTVAFLVLYVDDILLIGNDVSRSFTCCSQLKLGQLAVLPLKLLLVPYVPLIVL